jgi:maltoporin
MKLSFKTLAFAILMSFPLISNAQFSIAAGSQYDFENFEKIGYSTIGGRLMYGFNPIFRASVEYYKYNGLNTYSGPDESHSIRELDFNVQLFLNKDLQRTTRLYFLAGSNIYTETYTYTGTNALYQRLFNSTSTYAGLNLGTGIEIKITDAIKLLGEIRYSTRTSASTNFSIILGAMIVYTFNGK